MLSTNKCLHNKVCASCTMPMPMPISMPNLALSGATTAHLWSTHARRLKAKRQSSQPKLLCVCDTANTSKAAQNERLRKEVSLVTPSVESFMGPQTRLRYCFMRLSSDCAFWRRQDRRVCASRDSNTIWFLHGQKYNLSTRLQVAKAGKGLIY